MYKKILLAADGSENSLRAAKEAIKIASSVPNCMIEVVYVADFSKSKSDILHSNGKEELALSRRQKLLPLEEQLKSKSLSYKVKILQENQVQLLLTMLIFDLVVIGSRGLNTLQEMVLGSVSHKVMKRVKCPALVVK